MSTLQTPSHPPRRCICVDSETTVLTASRLMRSFEVEELVVTDRKSNALVPAGIVSARDIVTRVVASGLDPAVLTARDIARTGSASAERAGSPDFLRSVLAAGNRTLPLLDRNGDLAGVVSQHDLLLALVPKHPPGATVAARSAG